MQWQSMKTAPKDGTLVCVTQQKVGYRVVTTDYYPFSRDSIAWLPPPPEPIPYTGTLEELDAEGGDA